MIFTTINPFSLLGKGHQRFLACNKWKIPMHHKYFRYFTSFDEWSVWSSCTHFPTTAWQPNTNSLLDNEIHFSIRSPIVTRSVVSLVTSYGKAPAVDIATTTVPPLKY